MIQGDLHAVPAVFLGPVQGRIRGPDQNANVPDSALRGNGVWMPDLNLGHDSGGSVIPAPSLCHSRPLLFVIPAQAGIQSFQHLVFAWFSAFTVHSGCPTKTSGMTGVAVSFPTPSFCHSRAGGNPEIFQTISSYKSLHSPFFSSISLNFHALFHFFICFSLEIASLMSPCTS